MMSDCKQTYDLSVVVPVYNDRMHIEGCVTSILKALSKVDISSEVIVLDNASYDGTFEVLNQFRNEITIFRNERTIPLFQNIKKVYSKAQGSYCLLVGSDDELESDFFHPFFVINENIHKCDIYIGNTRCIYTNKKEEIYDFSYLNRKKSNFFNSIFNKKLKTNLLISLIAKTERVQNLLRQLPDELHRGDGIDRLLLLGLLYKASVQFDSRSVYVKRRRTGSDLVQVDFWRPLRTGMIAYKIVNRNASCKKFQAFGIGIRYGFFKFKTELKLLIKICYRAIKRFVARGEVLSKL